MNMLKNGALGGRWLACARACKSRRLRQVILFALLAVLRDGTTSPSVLLVPNRSSDERFYRSLVFLEREARLEFGFPFPYETRVTVAAS